VRSAASRIDVSQLWIVSVADATKRLLSKGDAVRPAWSPNGSRIAFDKQVGVPRGTPPLWTIPAAGPADTGAVPLTKDVAWDSFPAWSGDGRYLYFSSSRGGPVNLWRVPVEEKSGRTLGPPESATVPALFADSPSVSRDGRRVAYESRSSRSTLRRIGFDARAGSVSGAPEELWSSSRDLDAPRLSPDGKWVALSRSSTGVESIAIARPDGTGLRQLFESDRSARFPRFSPDGQRVAFFSDRSGSQTQIWEIHADGSGLKQLSDFPDHAMFYPLYSPDGSRLEAIDDKGGTWLLDRNHPDSKWTPLHKPIEGEPLPDSNSSWSKDGRFFAGDLIDMAYRQLGIYVESVETGERRRLTEKGRLPVWLSDDRRILYEREGAIWIIDSATGKTSEILPALKPPRSLSAFDLAPDETYLLILEDAAESDIWLRTQD